MQSRYSVFLLGFILFLVYWQWFLPGPKVANDFPMISKELLNSMTDLSRTWSEKGAEGLGEYSAFFLWSWPLSFISGVLSNIGITFSVLEKIFILIPILFLGGIGIWKLCKNLNLSNPSKVVCSFFYLTNTYILLLIDGGQLSIGLAYAFFPISFLAVERALKLGLKNKIIAGLGIALLGFFDIRFIYVLVILCLIHIFYQFLFLGKKGIRDWIFSWLKTGTVVGIIFVFLHFYWLLPLFKAPIPETTYTFFTQFGSSNTNLGHALLLISPHWYKNVFGVILSLKWEFILLPIAVFLAPVLRPKNKALGFWLVTALLSTFLAKGNAEPLPNVYPWLFEHIPYFSIFRDSTKFFVLVALSYTVLIGFSLDEIIKRIKSVKIKKIFLIFTIFYLLFLIRPVWLGWMSGTFSNPPLTKEYFKLTQVLENDTAFNRVFWIPHFTPLGYSSPIHPRVEAARLVQKRPFAIGTQGSYETFNFLREAPYMGEIFDVAGIGYIVYPYLDAGRDDMHPDNIKYYYAFSNQLSNLPWLSKISDSPIPLWRVNEHQDRFFITPNIWLVIGSDSIYNQTIKNADLKLSKNALIFAEEYPGLGQRIDQLPEAKIVLNNKSILDLAASFIDSSNLIFPAKNLSLDPDQSGWWKREAKDLIRWRDFLQTKYGIDNLDFDLGGGWAVGENNLKFKIENLKLKKDNILLARVLESTRSGQLKFYQEDKLIGKINTLKEGNNIRWFEVGQLADGEELVIDSSGDINVVNALAILDKDEWLKLQNKAQSLQNRIADFDAKNTRNQDTAVTYQQINPTKYKVSIKNLTGPSFLIFSQTYDGFWKMNGQKSLPMYSLLNGFRVEKDGEYLIEFEVQKYVYPGLIISGATLIFTILLLFKTRKPRKFHI